MMMGDYDQSQMVRYQRTVASVRRELYLLYESMPTGLVPDEYFLLLERLENILEEYHGPLEANELGIIDAKMPLTIPECLTAIGLIRTDSYRLQKSAEDLFKPSEFVSALRDIADQCRSIDDNVHALTMSALNPATPGKEK